MRPKGFVDVLVMYKWLEEGRAVFRGRVAHGKNSGLVYASDFSKKQIPSSLLPAYLGWKSAKTANTGRHTGLRALIPN